MYGNMPPPIMDFNCATPPDPNLITNIVPAINLIWNNGEDGWKPTRKIKDWKTKRFEFTDVGGARGGKTQAYREWVRKQDEDPISTMEWILYNIKNKPL